MLTEPWRVEDVALWLFAVSQEHCISDLDVNLLGHKLLGSLLKPLFL